MPSFDLRRSIFTEKKLTLTENKIILYICRISSRVNANENYVVYHDNMMMMIQKRRRSVKQQKRKIKLKFHSLSVFIKQFSPALKLIINVIL